MRGLNFKKTMILGVDRNTFLAGRIFACLVWDAVYLDHQIHELLDFGRKRPEAVIAKRAMLRLWAATKDWIADAPISTKNWDRSSWAS
jgi:hypothetical protein